MAVQTHFRNNMQLKNVVFYTTCSYLLKTYTKEYKVHSEYFIGILSNLEDIMFIIDIIDGS